MDSLDALNCLLQLLVKICPLCFSSGIIIKIKGKHSLVWLHFQHHYYLSTKGKHKSSTVCIMLELVVYHHCIFWAHYNVKASYFVMGQK